MTTTHPGRIQRSLEFAQDSKVHVCSCSELMDLVEPESLDAVFTDPPYPKEFLGCWDDLRRLADHALRPGGLVLALSGHMHLPEVMRRLAFEGTLRYRWMGALVWRTTRTMFHGPKVSNGWKPFLAYSKPGPAPDFYAADAFRADPITRSTQAKHVWGQDQALMNELAKEWLQPGWRVADPFCGAGSLLFAAQETGCSVLGCDTDPDHVNTTRGKLT